LGGRALPARGGDALRSVSPNTHEGLLEIR